MDMIASTFKMLCEFHKFVLSIVQSVELEPDRNSMILCNLEKTSLGIYKRFGTALLKTEQSHVWNLLKPPDPQRIPENLPVMETGYGLGNVSALFISIFFIIVIL
jgi:hypothetical protein